MLPVLNRDNLWCSAGQILTPDVPEVPRDRDSLVKELRSLESRLSVFARLKASMGSVSFVSGSEDIEDDAMCLLDIDYAQQATNIYVFPPDQALRAQREYAKREGEKRGQMLILFGTFCWFAFRRLETLPTVIRITQLTSHMFLRF